MKITHFILHGITFVLQGLFQIIVLKICEKTSQVPN